MLSSTVVRKMTLKEELDVLFDIDKYKGRGKLNRKGPSSPGKRGLPAGKEGRSAKKMKLLAGKPAASEEGRSAKKMKLLAGKPAASEGKVIGMPKLKGDNAGPSFDPLQNEQIRPDAPSSKPVLPKNETPNRFWAFEPYCAPIAQDDIKLLEDLIKGHSDMTEYYKVPKLGQHYTQRWAKEDLENERLRGAADANASIDGKGSEEAIQMLKKAEAANEE